MGKFTLESITPLRELKVGDILNESDFSTTVDDKFLQFKFHEDKKQWPELKVTPGLYKIGRTMMGLHLQPTEMIQNELLEEFISTEEIENVVDQFFDNLHVYAELNVEVPTRNMLLWGPPGTGKTSAIGVACRKYLKKGGTAVITWDSNAFEAYDVKSFINSFKYDGVERLILVVEDLGGIENENVRMRQDSSLLSLLDNTDKTFKIPSMVISTTNHPENLGAALANRSGRFDDKIRVPFPGAEARLALLNFFSKNAASSEAKELIFSNKCEKFPPAHIREAYIRSRLRSRPLHKVIEDMIGEIEQFEGKFGTKRR